MLVKELKRHTKVKRVPESPANWEMPTGAAMRTNGSRQVLMSWPLTPLHTSDQKPFVFHAENHATLIMRTANRLGQTQSVSGHNGVFDINKIDYVTDLQVNDLLNGGHLSKSGHDELSGQNAAMELASKLWLISEINTVLTLTRNGKVCFCTVNMNYVQIARRKWWKTRLHSFSPNSCDAFDCLAFFVHLQ